MSEDLNRWRLTLIFLGFLTLSLSPVSFAGEGLVVRIVLESGPQDLEIHRLYPDRVIVIKEGGARVQLERKDILKAGNPEADGRIKAAQGVLSHLPNLSFPGIENQISELNHTIAEMEEIHLNYDWLIPQASETLSLLKPAKKDLEGIINLSQTAENRYKNISLKAESDDSLPQEWKQIGTEFDAELSSINYPRIKEELSEKLRTRWREVEEEVDQHDSRMKSRFEEIVRKVSEKISQETLTRKDWDSHSSSARAAVSSVGDPKLKETLLVPRPG